MLKAVYAPFNRNVELQDWISFAGHKSFSQQTKIGVK